MNKNLIKDSFLHRKADLKQQLSNASLLSNEEDVSILEAQWVHRFGFETLPTNSKILSSTNSKSLFTGNQYQSSFVTENGHNKEREADFSSIASDTQVRRAVSSLEPSQTEDLDVKDVKDVKDVNDASLKERVEDFKSSKQDCAELKEHEIFVKHELFVSPPPRSLKRLRRWIPMIEENLPKAS